ncbi:MAG: TonB-dependent receptor [Candidatus Goldiibacteriota bacterium]
MKRLCFVFTVVLCLAFAVFADEGAERQDLGEVIVQEEQENESPAGTAPDAKVIYSFDKELLENTNEWDAAGVLKEVPGVQVSSPGLINIGVGSANPSFIKIRGTGNNPNSGIIAVVDGRPKYMGLWKHPLFDTLSLDNVKSIDVIKGPSGVQYGNQAVGGVIEIKTKRAEKEGAETVINGFVGNYYTQNYSINTIAKKNRLDLNVSAGHRSTRGHRPNSDAYLENYSARLGGEINENWYASAGGGYSFINGYNPGPEGSEWTREREAYQTIQRDMDINIEHNYDSVSGRIILFSDSGSNDFIESATPMNVPIPGSYNSYRNYGIKVIEEFALAEGNRTKAGFDWQLFGGFFENFPPMPAMKKKVETYEHEWAPYIMSFQKAGPLRLSAGIRYAVNDKWGDKFIPQLGLDAKVVKNINVFANFSTGYKTPAAGTLIFADYEDLAPEDYSQYEAGLKFEKKGSWGALASVYQTEGNNIYRTDPSDGLLKSMGYTLIRGAETDAWVNMGRHVKTGILFSYSDPREKTAFHSFLNAKAYMQALLFKKVEIKAESVFVKDRYDSDHKKDKLDDYAVFNLSISGTDKKKDHEKRFYLEIENIFDVKYETTAGYPAAGFIIRSGMTIKL